MKQSQIDKFVHSPKGKANRDTLLKTFKFTLRQFVREISDYRGILRSQIESDYVRGVGVYSPELDLEAAIIRIPNRSGFLIPHSVSEIRRDPDTYIDNYTITALLYQELFDH